MTITSSRDRFGDNDEMADRLGGFVVQGIKTATCSAYDPNKPIPKVGDRTTIEDSQGRPLCIIETTEVRIIPFNQIDAKFVYDEGEDDRTLESWRKEHQTFFGRNGGFKPDMLLVCERFKVVQKF